MLGCGGKAGGPHIDKVLLLTRLLKYPSTTCIFKEYLFGIDEYYPGWIGFGRRDR